MSAARNRRLLARAERGMSDLIERLNEEAMRLSGRSLDRGCADSGISSNLADEAAARIDELDQKLLTTSLEALAISDTNKELQARLSGAVKVLEEMTKALNEFASLAPSRLSCGMRCSMEIEHMEEEAYAAAHDHATFQLSQAKAFITTLAEKR